MILEKQKISILNLNFEKLVLYSLYSLSILVPLIIGKPQLLVGSVVNFLIVYSTLTFGLKKTFPILFLPSITATMTGILFNGATYFLIYVLPFIITSNFILSYFISKKKIWSYILGILFKGGFLVIAYLAMNKVIGLPSIFITSSYIQFITASIGVVLGFSIYQLSKKT